MIQDWYIITIDALLNLWQGFLAFIPELIGALIIFLVGWLISVGIGRLIVEILKKIQFNKIFEKGNWDEALAKADLRVNPAEFIGSLVKWILVIVFLLAAVEVLGLVQFAEFLTDVLGYLPNVVVAALIFVVAVIIADFADKIIKASVARVKTGYVGLTGVIVKWAIWIFAILAILLQLRVAPSLIQILFTGVVALIAIAGGIAFGLGGKDVAGEILQDIKKRFKKE